MAKFTSLVQFSEVFGIDPAIIDRLGVLDPTLSVDVPLFVDPLLLSHSRHSEMKTARRTYEDYFDRIIRLLLKSQRAKDFAWESAKALLLFPEIKGTCLGYGATIDGSGVGKKYQDILIDRAVKIVGLGIDDPDLFVSTALLESGIGADRVSDMTVNASLEKFEAFNNRIAPKLGLKTEELLVTVTRAGRFTRNPLAAKPTPVVLVPLDVLRRLPIATDWDSAMDAASANAAIRHRVNQHIGNVWAIRTKKDKEEVRNRVYSSTEAFKALLARISHIDSRFSHASG